MDATMALIQSVSPNQTNCLSRVTHAQQQYQQWIGERELHTELFPRKPKGAEKEGKRMQYDKVEKNYKNLIITVNWNKIGCMHAHVSLANNRRFHWSGHNGIANAEIINF